MGHGEGSCAGSLVRGELSVSEPAAKQVGALKEQSDLEGTPFGKGALGFSYLFFWRPPAS